VGTELEVLADRIDGDRKELLHLGVEVFWVQVGDDELDRRDLVVADLAAPAGEAAARQLMSERYGPLVRINYLGAESWVSSSVEWDSYRLASPTEIVVAYDTLASRAPDATELAEDADGVTITLRERRSVFAEKLLPARREAHVTLSEPLGARIVIDGATRARRFRE
jgi:hypothetical protein